MEPTHSTDTINWGDLFEYDPTSPTFLVNKLSRGPRALKGTPAGCVGSKEIKVRYQNKFYRSSRIVWELHNGPIPSGMLIHFKDNNSFNLNIDNLSLQTRREKGVRYASLTNKLGETGIYAVKDRFQVQVKCNGAYIYVGTYKTLKQAKVMRDRALKLIDGGKK